MVSWMITCRQLFSSSKCVINDSFPAEYTDHFDIAVMICKGTSHDRVETNQRCCAQPSRPHCSPGQPCTHQPRTHRPRNQPMRTRTTTLTTEVVGSNLAMSKTNAWTGWLLPLPSMAQLYALILVETRVVTKCASQSTTTRPVVQRAASFRTRAQRTPPSALGTTKGLHLPCGHSPTLLSSMDSRSAKLVCQVPS